MQSSTLASGTSGQPAVALPLAARRAAAGARLSYSLRQWWRFKLLAGGTILLLLVLIGAFGPLLAPFDPNSQALSESLVAPHWLAGRHSLGTDNLGRDVLSRLLSGARISLLVACSVVLVAGVVGFTLGAI